MRNSELLVLLKEADFHPDKIAALQVNRTERSRPCLFEQNEKDLEFRKEKKQLPATNFQNAEYFNAYRLSSALQD